MYMYMIIIALPNQKKRPLHSSVNITQSCKSGKVLHCILFALIPFEITNAYSLVSDRSRYVLLVDSTLGLMRGTTLGWFMMKSTTSWSVASSPCDSGWKRSHCERTFFTVTADSTVIQEVLFCLLFIPSSSQVLIAFSLQLLMLVYRLKSFPPTSSD